MLNSPRKAKLRKVDPLAWEKEQHTALFKWMDRICGYVAVGRTTKRLALRTLNSFINFLLIYNSFMILTRRGEGGGCLKQLLKASTCAALFPSYSFFSCTLYVPPPCYSILFRHFSSEYLNHPLLPSAAQRTESSTWHKHRTVT